MCSVLQQSARRWRLRMKIEGVVLHVIAALWKRDWPRMELRWRWRSKRGTVRSRSLPSLPIAFLLVQYPTPLYHRLSFWSAECVCKRRWVGLRFVEDRSTEGRHFDRDWMSQIRIGGRFVGTLTKIDGGKKERPPIRHKPCQALPVAKTQQMSLPSWSSTLSQWHQRSTCVLVDHHHLHHYHHSTWMTPTTMIMIMILTPNYPGDASHQPHCLQVWAKAGGSQCWGHDRDVPQV